MSLGLRALALIGAAVLVASLGVAGCGDDEDAPTTSTSTVTSTTAAGDLVEQANAVCIEGDKELKAVQNQVTQDESLDAYVNAVAPVIQGTLDEVAALPGVDDDPAITEWVETSQQALDDLVDDPDLLSRAENPFAESYRVGREAGLDACIPG